MASNLFENLRHGYPDLFEHLIHAEQCCETNPRSALASVRMFGEDLAKMLAARAGIHDLGMKQPVRVRALQEKGVVSVPVARALKSIQRLGSSALHDAIKSVKNARQALIDAQEVAVWLSGSVATKPISETGAHRIGAVPRPANAWAIRPYPHYSDRRAEFLSEGIIAVGWPMTGDLTDQDKIEVLKVLRRLYPEREARWTLDCGVLLRFRDAIAVGDLAVMTPYTSDDRKVAIGQITGNYRYRPERADTEDGYAHQHTVRWFNGLVARSDLPMSIQACLNWRGIIQKLNKSALESYCRDRGWL